jgi:hypothetical protein
MALHPFFGKSIPYYRGESHVRQVAIFGLTAGGESVIKWKLSVDGIKAKRSAADETGQDRQFESIFDEK